ncbi:antitoxin [Streptomyces sp. NPDC002889]|uniref:antitoxin n=1 Tax=Streptomyces sp. NPDC002889 TaxID=3364669 RepID=UPI0036C1FF26
MGFMDSLKARLAPATHKVSEFALHHEDKIGNGLEKAAKTVDAKTKGKYSNKIETSAGKAKQTLGRIAHKDDGTTPDDATKPPVP